MFFELNEFLVYNGNGTIHKKRMNNFEVRLTAKELVKSIVLVQTLKTITQQDFFIYFMYCLT